MRPGPIMLCINENFPKYHKKIYGEREQHGKGAAWQSGLHICVVQTISFGLRPNH